MRLVLSLGILALATAPAFAEQLSCDGVFGIDTSEARFAESYGRANVVTGEVPGPEGEPMLVTTVFPGTAREFRVWWYDEINLKELAYASVPAGDVSPGGLSLGMGIAEVEALNGEPFELTGFYWDYGGSGWFQKGRLADLPGGCVLSFTFGPTAPLPESVDDDAIVGDKLIRSDLPILRQAKPVLEEILFGHSYDAFPRED